jgi:hypothetical protein
MQTWHEVTNHLPPLAGKEPPEMIAGEEGNEEEKEDDERTESDSDGFSQEAAGRTSGTKRGAASSSQTSR